MSDRDILRFREIAIAIDVPYVFCIHAAKNGIRSLEQSFLSYRISLECRMVVILYAASVCEKRKKIRKGLENYGLTTILSGSAFE